MSEQVYINSVGKFLPGDPVPNDEMEDYLGYIGGKPSRLKSRMLKQNGIRFRHYAIDREGHVRYWNSEMAAIAARDALSRSSLDLKDIRLLAAATSQGDLLAPGFASMVHGELRLPPCEIASYHGICASGMMALKGAYLNLLAGEKANAVVCASEFTSRFFRPGIFEETVQFKETGRVGYDAEFLRWMLSDGAGAVVLETRPNERGLSLRIEWVDLISYADRFDVCMYAGTNKGADGRQERSWYDYRSCSQAAEQGAILLKQDLSILENIVPLGVGRYFELVEKGRVRPDEVDWMLCHYSSHYFRSKIFDLVERGGATIPEEKWFTNLYTKGNTGSASIFIMLEELLNEGHVKAGQKIFCMVPESGRFTISFMLLTAVEGAKAEVGQTVEASDISIDSEMQMPADSSVQSRLIRQLSNVWIDFETGLNQVPIVDKINRGKLHTEDYKLLLLNLRQQVSEGARWIARAASNITIEAFDLRSTFIRHAAEEHRDFQMIERDYVSVGGSLDAILEAEKNIGSEALSAWMFHRASQENPFDLLGAMFIIEGLGMRLAQKWGKKICEQLELKPEQVSFLLYHGANDENHMERFEKALSSGLLTEKIAARIVKTAKVTARLYRLQLEELGNV